MNECIRDDKAKCSLSSADASFSASNIYIFVCVFVKTFGEKRKIHMTLTDLRSAGISEFKLKKKKKTKGEESIFKSEDEKSTRFH